MLEAEASSARPSRQAACVQCWPSVGPVQAQYRCFFFLLLLFRLCFDFRQHENVAFASCRDVELDASVAILALGVLSGSSLPMMGSSACTSEPSSLSGRMVEWGWSAWKRDPDHG